MKEQESTPIEEDCPDCDGVGEFCTYAPPEGEREYMHCETCGGTGVKP